ncbi:MAG: hypothetical protein R3C68_12495 [Myxococcota bacterium]
MSAKVSALLCLSACSADKPVSLPFQSAFDEATLGSPWESRGGGWRVVEGRLFNDGARNVPLWLNAELPDDVRVTFTAQSMSPAVDIKFEIFGDGRRHQSGYVVILSGWNNTKSIIARLDEHGPERDAPTTEHLRSEVQRDALGALRRYRERREIVARAHHGLPKHTYHLRFERQGHELRLFVDERLHLSYFDPAPLGGAGHNRFAFSNWASKVYFDDLKIESL